MTLEEMIATCIEAGVTRFTLRATEDSRGPEQYWWWEVDRGYRERWFHVVKPWSYRLEWLGFGPDESKPFGFLPFDGGFEDWWLIGVHTGSERHGYQGGSRPGAPEHENGLRSALGRFLCEDEGEVCPHTICAYHEDCLRGED